MFLANREKPMPGIDDMKLYGRTLILHSGIAPETQNLLLFKFIADLIYDYTHGAVLPRCQIHNGNAPLSVQLQSTKENQSNQT